MPRANSYRVAPQQEAPAAPAERAPQPVERPTAFRDHGLFRGHRVAPAGQNRSSTVGLSARLAHWGNAVSVKIASGFRKVSEMINRGGELRRMQEAQDRAEAARIISFIVARRIDMQERYEIQCEMHRPAPAYEEIVVNPPSPPSPPSYTEVVGAPPSYEDTV